MTPPVDDLYAFLGLPATAVPEAVQQALARTEKRLSGKHGLTLTELSRQRALLLQAKRWLVPAERKEEYDRSHASVAGPNAATEPRSPEPAKRRSQAPRPQEPSKPRPVMSPGPIATASPRVVATSPKRLTTTPVLEADDAEAEDAPSWISLPALLAALVAAVVLTFGVSFAIVWTFSRSSQPAASATDGEGVAAQEPPAPVVNPENETAAADSSAEPALIRAVLSGRIVLTPTNAKLIGPTIRLDEAENPPRIENWTSSDRAEWDFESPEVAIYQATLEYGMKPECEGNRFAISVGPVSMTRTVGGGAYDDGVYRDVFFLKIEKRGPTTLKIEPRDVVGGELMQFRELTLAPRQKTAAP